jgi:hypothetical protein
MPTTELTTDKIKVTVTTELVGGSIVPANDPHLLSVLSSANAMHASVPLKQVKLAFDSGVQHTYRIEALDGRIWKQKLFFNVGAEVTMTFDVTHQWKMSEFVLQRDVRDHLIDLVRGYVGVILVKLDYL